MKNLFAFILVIILVTGCNQVPPEIHQVEIGLYTPYYLFPEILNGKVKSVIEKNYLAIEKDGKFVKDIPLTIAARDSINWTRDFELRYDESGILVYSADIDEHGNEILRWDISAQDNKMTKAELTRDDTLRLVAKLSYDEAGNLSMIQQFRMPADSLVFQSRVIMDENGNMAEWVYQDPAGESTGNRIFAVNLEGKRTGYKNYNKEGDQVFEQQYTYNDRGHLIKQVMIGSEGQELVSEYDYMAYDDMGNWASVAGSDDKYVIIAERTISYYE